MTPEQAVALWPRLEATGMRLGSPAVDAGPNAYEWLDSFFAKCVGCRVDFIAMHWYSTWNPAPGHCNRDELFKNIQFFAGRYGKPVWLTEFDCADGGAAANIALVNTAVTGIGAASPSLERYAWFTTRNFNAIPPYYQGVELINDDGTWTDLGHAYYSAVSG